MGASTVSRKSVPVRRTPAFSERSELGIFVGRVLGISEPGIGPGRPAPDTTVPPPVESPEGVTPLVSELAPETPVLDPTLPMGVNVSSAGKASDGEALPGDTGKDDPTVDVPL